MISIINENDKCGGKMSVFKKIIAAIICLAIAVTFASCSSTGSDTTTVKDILETTTGKTTTVKDPVEYLDGYDPIICWKIY